MLVISTREFRAKQGKYLKLVKNGEEVILKSRENGSFALTPVTEYSTLIPKEYILKTKDEDLKRAITGEELLERLIPRVEKLFNK
ncbi:Antitoxin Phd_YefM, type II toxin-antitoxin system [Porphyromonadaceae bacterium KH3R12]|nr:Antitoxin Phd_YefM, type II toxin-antitoxin system [Porphyromonadaceae bacterium KH3R12]